MQVTQTIRPSAPKCEARTGYTAGEFREEPLWCHRSIALGSFRDAQGVTRFACQASGHLAQVKRMYGEEAERPGGERARLYFWPKVDTSGECWTWTAARTAWGYGRLNDRRAGQMKAHRVSWEIHNGPIPDGMWVLHTCDNPPCVRPDHLYLGTVRDNVRDMYARGRAAPGERTRNPGEKAGAARLTNAQAREIRYRFEQGGVTKAQLARDFGASSFMVWEIVVGRSFRVEDIGRFEDYQPEGLDGLTAAKARELLEEEGTVYFGGLPPSHPYRGWTGGPIDGCRVDPRLGRL